MRGQFRVSSRLAETFATTTGPSRSAIVVRLVVVVAGWASLLLAVPSPVYRYAPVVVVVTGVIAAVTAVLPRRHLALILELLVVALWLLPGGHPGPTAVAAVLLAALLYAHHAASALAAATGWDVRTTGSLARGWSLRSVATVVTASALSVVMLALTGLSGTVLPDATLLVGLLAAVLAVAVPLVRLRRRGTGVSGPGGRPLDSHTFADD